MPVPALAVPRAAPAETDAARMASRLRLLHVVTAPSAEPFDVRLDRALALTATLLGLEIGILSRIRDGVFTAAAAHSTGAAIAAGTAFPLGDTYCSITLARDDVYAEAHMTRSEHRDHPCVNAFGLESYIGIPVRVAGEVTGTLCFLGKRPSPPFSEADHDLLRVLAMWVGGALEQQDQHREIAERGALVSGLYDASPQMMGVVELADGPAGPETDVLHCSDNAATAALFGTTPEALRGRLASASGVSARVLALWTDAYRRAEATAAPVTFEYDDETPAGVLAVAATVALVAPTDALSGRRARFCYVARDVTAERAARHALAASERRNRLLSEATFEGIAFTRAGIILDANEQFARMLGFASVADVVGAAAVALITPETADRVRTAIAEGRTEPYEAEALRHDGSRFWAEIQGRAFPYIDGGEARLTAFRDVSRRKAAEQQIRFQADVLAHVSDAVVALDLDGCVTYWNAGAERLHGFAAEAVLGRPLASVVRYHVPAPAATPDAAPAVTPAADARDALREAAGGLGDLFYDGPSGGRRVVSVSASLLRGDDGAERGVLAVLRDVTPEREIAARIRHQALHDALTGLPNRVQFRNRVADALAGHAPFSVLYVDLDRFKGVNDTLGHAAGDRLLLAAAARMAAAVEAAGPGGVVARLGGDEFAVVMPGDARMARRVARALLAAVRQSVRIGAREIVPSASVGVVARAERYTDPEALLRDADTAMYDAKRAGRDRAAFFDVAMHTAVAERFALEHDLRRALRDRQFSIHLQPIVDLRSGAVAGFEALARWEHPLLGFIGPTTFIPLAEELGLVAEIDGLVLDAACREIGAWAGSHLLTMVNVNCSDQSFMQAGLAERARAAADAAGMDPARLTLELTERALVAPDAAQSAAQAIRAQGLRLCVDDFGSGYSSLGLLHRLPVDGLKIDRSFVSDLDTSAAAQAVVRAVVQFSSDLGLRTVAEGIETPGQLRRLRAMGCRYGQGYLFSPPVAADVARAMVDAPPWAAQWPMGGEESGECESGE